MLPLEQVKLRDLPKTPKIDEANYGWTGRYGEYPCLLVGDRELAWDDSARTSYLDTRPWLNRAFSEPQRRRSKKFHQVAPGVGQCTLIYVYEDVGTGLTSTGEHQAKRGRKKFTGLFKIVERDEDWIRADLMRRD